MTQTLMLGCGVIGLSSAIRLLENGFSTHIITKEMPEHTTSAAAGAIWAGHLPGGRQKQWSATALKIFQEQARDQSSGVLITRFRELYRYPVSAPWFMDLLDYCEPMPHDEVSAGYVSGYISDVPLVQTPKYLDYLRNRFLDGGGSIEQREIQSLSELVDYPLIINCTGVDARKVANDDAVHPIWGQVLLVDAPHITESMMDDEKFTYILPRNDGVVLGGIHGHDRWQRESDDAVTADIIKRCQQLNPELGDVKIIKIPVGLRPGRHEVRLEREQLTENCTVIHNYGHGGIGYTLSWGCAEDVVRLAKQV